MAHAAPLRAQGGRADQLLSALVQVARLGHHLVPATQELGEVLGQLLEGDVGLLDEPVLELGLVVTQGGRAGQVVQVQLALPEKRLQPERHLAQPHLKLLADLELQRRLRAGVPDVGQPSEGQEHQRDHHQGQPGGDAEPHASPPTHAGPLGMRVAGAEAAPAAIPLRNELTSGRGRLHWRPTLPRRRMVSLDAAKPVTRSRTA